MHKKLGLDFLALLGFSFMFFPCNGVITSPRENMKYIFLPGRTGNITWEFNDTSSSLVSRSWTFHKNNERLAILFLDQKIALIEKTSYEVDIVAPATLVLKNVNQSYDGIYSFALTVTGGSSTRYVRVFIASKPTVTLNCSSRVMVKKGDNLTCLCKGEGGNPPANVTWYKDGVKISDIGTEKQKIKIWNAKITDHGNYKCVAKSYDHENYTDEKSIKVTAYKLVVLRPTILSMTRPTPQSLSSTMVAHWKDPEQSIVNDNETRWYIVVVSLVSGIFIGILFSFTVLYSRRKFKRRKSQKSKPERPTPQVDSTYQELDLTKMNKEDNYQSLGGNAVKNDGVNNDDESNYTELN